MGSLSSNGQVYLLNPNGVVVGPNGRVNTAGFVASMVTYFLIVRPLQQTKKIREEEKEIFILTATLLWGIMLQELIAYFYTNNAKTVAPIVEGVVRIVGVRTRFSPRWCAGW